MPILLLILLAMTAGCTMTTSNHRPVPPDVAQRPVSDTRHGDVRVDEYSWLREKENPEVISYLEAENAYAKATMAHTDELQETLYAEMLGRIKEDDSGVPWRKGDWLYYDRTEEGKPYPIQCRRRGSMSSPEQILLDENELAGDSEYLNISRWTVSPDGTLLAWLEDRSGYEQNDLFVKNIETGELIGEPVRNLGPWSLAWASDNETLFYTRQDETNRPDRVYRRNINDSGTGDELVYHDPDGRFFVGVERTRSGAWLLIGCGSQITSEYQALAADDPNGSFSMIAPRRNGVEYTVDHHGDSFYILTNDDAMNFRIVKAPVETPGAEHWVDVIAHDPDVHLLGHSMFKDFMAVSSRQDGYRGVRLMDLGTGRQRSIAPEEEVSSLTPGTNRAYDTDIYRFNYTSLITPSSIYDEDVATGDRTLRKRTEVLGGYDPENYETTRMTATAHDGIEIPMSIVHRKGVKPDGTNPVLLYGYGSYGFSMDPYFSSSRVSLLDRGVVYAIGHIRGGSERGRQWYEDGKFLKKRNTFEDFISCGEALKSSGWADPGRIAIQGGSAGGLLIGATINMRPELFCAAHAAVPFVDVMNTMLDPTIPLTVIEYEEWGNPNDPIYYEYMKSYSPYDNVGDLEYPDLLVTAGLNDPRVHYWEPAKWTARMRDHVTGESMLIMKTNMGAGHGGASGRYGRLHEIAFEYAFLLDRLGATSDDIVRR
ncbi:MAG: S9 family peptidase [Phycisphaerales bacterium]|nr:S9 family peptidase [Phycisphaerales bacterium]